MSSSYPNTKSSQQRQQTTTQQAPPTGPTYEFTQDEVIFIENVLVELRSLIPNDMGENMPIMEKIILAEQIIGARLDPDEAIIGDTG